MWLMQWLVTMPYLRVWQFTALPLTSFLAGFAAEITFRSGYVETQHGFLTQAGALEWVGERLVEDQDPANEA